MFWLYQLSWHGILSKMILWTAVYIYIIFFSFSFSLLQGTEVRGALNGKDVFNVAAPKATGNGFVAIGTDTYGIADFDNFRITSAADGLLIVNELQQQSDSRNKDTLYFEPEGV